MNPYSGPSGILGSGRRQNAAEAGATVEGVGCFDFPIYSHEQTQ